MRQRQGNLGRRRFRQFNSLRPFVALLIWLPMIAAGHISAFNWGETYATWVLTAAAWVVADSYRGMRWPGPDK